MSKKPYQDKLRLVCDFYSALKVTLEAKEALLGAVRVSCGEASDECLREGGCLEQSDWNASCAIISTGSTTFSFIVPPRLFAVKLVPCSIAFMVYFVAKF